MTPVFSMGPPERRARINDCFGPDIFEHAQDLDLKILHPVAGKDGFAGRMHARFYVLQREEFHGGSSGKQADEERQVPQSLQQRHIIILILKFRRP
jgi:hypothetical protein